MKGIKILLVMFFVLLFSNTAFAQIGGMGLGSISDSTSLLMAAWQGNSDEPVNYSKGSGKFGNGGEDGNRPSGGGGGGGNSGSGKSGNGRGDRANGCEDGIVGPGDTACGPGFIDD